MYGHLQSRAINAHSPLSRECPSTHHLLPCFGLLSHTGDAGNIGSRLTLDVSQTKMALLRPLLKLPKATDGFCSQPTALPSAIPVQVLVHELLCRSLCTSSCAIPLQVALPSNALPAWKLEEEDPMLLHHRPWLVRMVWDSRVRGTCVCVCL